MDEKTRSLVMLAGALTAVGGLIIDGFVFKRYRSPQAPAVPSFNPRNWRTRREWFTDPQGMRLHRMAGWMMFAGAMVGAIAWFTR